MTTTCIKKFKIDKGTLFLVIKIWCVTEELLKKTYHEKYQHQRTIKG